MVCDYVVGFYFDECGVVCDEYCEVDEFVQQCEWVQQCLEVVVVGYVQVVVEFEWYVLQQVVKCDVEYQCWYEVVDEQVLVLVCVLVWVGLFVVVVEVYWLEEQCEQYEQYCEVEVGE